MEKGFDSMIILTVALCLYSEAIEVLNHWDRSRSSLCENEQSFTWANMIWGENPSSSMLRETYMNNNDFMLPRNSGTSPVNLLFDKSLKFAS